MPPVSDVVPLTRTALSMADWLAPDTVTPAAWPCKAPKPLVTRPLFICSLSTVWKVLKVSFCAAAAQLDNNKAAARHILRRIVISVNNYKYTVQTKKSLLLERISESGAGGQAFSIRADLLADAGDVHIHSAGCDNYIVGPYFR